jgi:hypothetical protein
MSMGYFRQRIDAGQSWRTFLAAVCVLLVVVFGVVQVAHTHSDGAASHADCGLCAAAHISVQVTYAPAAAPPVAVFTAVEFVPAVVLPPTISTFALFTRPPPALLLAA